MIIYLLADPRLDAEVTKKAPDVRIAFRDATYSPSEMEAAVQQLLADTDYWRDQGTTIVAAAPAINGSGVQVTTSGDQGELANALRSRYPTMTFTVREGTVNPPVYTGPAPTFGHELLSPPLHTCLKCIRSAIQPAWPHNDHLTRTPAGVLPPGQR